MQSLEKLMHNLLMDLVSLKIPTFPCNSLLAPYAPTKQTLNNSKIRENSQHNHQNAWKYQKADFILSQHFLLLILTKAIPLLFPFKSYFSWINSHKIW